jgi:hypothetical protein
MLAGGEEDVGRAEIVGVAWAGDVYGPEVAVAVEGFGRVAAEDERVGGGGLLEESFVERAAREGLRGEGELGGGDAEGACETDALDAHGAECGEIEAEGVEGGESFGGEEVAADFIVGSGRAFEEGDVTAGEGELDGGGGACRAPADDDGVEMGGDHHRMRATQRRFIGWDSMEKALILA